MLARFSYAPKQRHWTGVKHIFRYLKGSIDLGLFFPYKTEVEDMNVDVPIDGNTVDTLAGPQRAPVVPSSASVALGSAQRAPAAICLGRQHAAPLARPCHARRAYRASMRPCARSATAEPLPRMAAPLRILESFQCRKQEDFVPQPKSSF